LKIVVAELEPVFTLLAVELVVPLDLVNEILQRDGVSNLYADSLQPFLPFKGCKVLVSYFLTHLVDFLINFPFSVYRVHQNFEFFCS